MLRVRGELEPGVERILDGAEIAKLTDELLTPEQRAHFAEHHDLDFAYGHGTKARFRANYLRKTTGVGAVFRTIPTKILTLDQLDVPAGIRRLTELTAGLVLVTGPTGSGKSTTLAAMIDHINRSRRGHILTIEDPVEFVHEPKQCLVTHKEVGVNVPSFLEAIRSAGRENADIILVGELRGAETMKLALQLASFGGADPRHRAHQLGGGDHRPLRQRLPRRPAAADPRPARRLAGRRGGAAALAQAATAAAGWRRTRS